MSGQTYDQLGPTSDEPDPRSVHGRCVAEVALESALDNGTKIDSELVEQKARQHLSKNLDSNEHLTILEASEASADGVGGSEWKFAVEKKAAQVICTKAVEKLRSIGVKIKSPSYR